MDQYAKIITALGGRKVLVCMIVFSATLAALWFGKLPASAYETIAITTMIAYGGANGLGKIAQVVAKKGRAGEVVERGQDEDQDYP